MDFYRDYKSHTGLGDNLMKPLRILFVGAGNRAEENLPVDANLYKQPLHRILDEFYAFVNSGIEPEISGRNNLRTIAPVEALCESSDRQQVVELPG